MFHMKSRFYVETSVISYLTAMPSRDLSVAAKQQRSLELWDVGAMAHAISQHLMS
jgi:hypothetical protein